MRFNYVVVDDPGFEADIYVDCKCQFCGGYYPLALIVGRDDAFNKDHYLGNQLAHNGHVHLEDCGDCWNHQEEL